MQDSDSEEYYLLDMIIKSLQDFDLKKEFLNVLVFDFLIGNTDRHQNNWGVIQEDKKLRLCPLYDNGSSLCCYIEQVAIQGYLGNDKLKLKSLVDTKSKSRIRIDGTVKREPTHKAVVEYLYANYYNEVIDLVKRIQSEVNENSIEALYDICDAILLTPERQQLIKVFIIEKVRILFEIFND